MSLKPSAHKTRATRLDDATVMHVNVIESLNCMTFGRRRALCKSLVDLKPRLEFIALLMRGQTPIACEALALSRFVSDFSPAIYLLCQTPAPGRASVNTVQLTNPLYGDIYTAFPYVVFH